jgi:hypothetical protein
MRVVEDFYLSEDSFTFRMAKFYADSVRNNRYVETLKRPHIELSAEYILANMTEDLIKHPRPHIYLHYIEESFQGLDQIIFGFQNMSEYNTPPDPHRIWLPLFEEHKNPQALWGLGRHIKIMPDKPIFEDEIYFKGYTIYDTLDWARMREKTDDRFESQKELIERFYQPSSMYFDPNSSAWIYWEADVDRATILKRAINIASKYNEEVYKHQNIPFYLNLFKRLAEFIKSVRKQVNDSLKNTVAEKIRKISSENETSYGNQVDLEHTANKILMAHKIGLLDWLEEQRKSKYPKMTDADFIEFVKMVLSLKGSSDHVRKTLRAIGTKGRDNPLTPKGLEKVSRELAKINITIT